MKFSDHQMRRPKDSETQEGGKAWEIESQFQNMEELNISEQNMESSKCLQCWWCPEDADDGWVNAVLSRACHPSAVSFASLCFRRTK